MLKNLVRLEHVVQDKVIHLVCDNDTSISAIKEGLCKFLSYIQQVEDQAKAQQEAQAKAEAEKSKEEAKDDQS